MKPRLTIQLTASAAVLVFAVGILSTGGKADWGWLDLYSYAATAAVMTYWLWERVVWKRPLVQRLGIVSRDISGTWQGTLTSLWTDPGSGTQPDPKTAYLVVRQTAFAVSVILLTDEAKSVSSLASVNSEDGIASLDYVYLGSPGITHEDRSRMHRGSASLNITGVAPTRLKGRYWTDRDSRGELDFTERAPHRAEDFEEAARLFEAEEGEK